MSLYDSITTLRDSWPQEFPGAQVKLYADRLSDYPAELVAEAVNALMVESLFRPTLAAIVERIAELALGLPTPEEAWLIAERGSLREADPCVRAAAEYVGGRWAIAHGDNPSTLRAQFRQAYTSLRAQALRDYATSRAMPRGMPELPPTEQMVRREIEP